MAMCHTILSDEVTQDDNSDQDDRRLAGVLQSSTYNNARITGVNNETDIVIIGVNEDEAINTVDGSKKQFSKKDRLKADIVRHFQHVAGIPSDATIIHSVNTNAIKNNPITRRDIVLTQDMLGRSKYAA